MNASRHQEPPPFKRTCRMMLAERCAPRSANQCIRHNRRAFAEGYDLEYLYSCALHHNQELLTRAKDSGTIRSMVVAGRVRVEFGRNVPFPRLWSNRDSALARRSICFLIARGFPSYVLFHVMAECKSDFFNFSRQEDLWRFHPCLRY